MERDQASKFINDLLKLMVSRNGSDLFITAEFPPAIKIDGKVTKVSPQPLSQLHTLALARAIMSDKHVEDFEHTKECNFAISPAGVGRFRVNAFVQQGKVGMVLRTIPATLPTIDSLGVPQILKEVTMTKRGLCILVGATGSGKSTTLAAMVDYLNSNEQGHILTVEDPIEFVHQSKKCLVNQREVGAMTKSFSAALRSALREDPDCILVGEMRDLETIRLAMTAAETGHLVFGTLHTSSAAKTIDRVIDVFPAEEKEMVRAMLSESLQAVISQALCKTKDGNGRVAAHEIMIGTSAIRNLIREAKVAQMYSAIQTGSNVGMQTLDQNLTDLVRRNIISAAEARAKAKNPENFPG